VAQSLAWVPDPSSCASQAPWVSSHWDYRLFASISALTLLLQGSAHSPHSTTYWGVVPGAVAVRQPAASDSFARSDRNPGGGAGLDAQRSQTLAP